MNIYIPDETLHSILPEGKILLNLEEKERPAIEELPAAQPLIYSILNALEEKHTDVLQHKQ